ncbi:MAG: hypothetical protein CEE40_04270 [Chloroflexi bacterium B3_Chlor]|nr:MAG: hypothetical protein CEE40_04270 [Chloroflexi bacterium B3_Chlor]
MLGSVRSRTLSAKKKEYLALTLIMALAIFVRFHQLQAIPVGVDGDQGADGYGAKRILRGEEYPVYLSNRWGVAPMHTYLVAFSFALWGTSLWAIRFASAAVGVLTIPVLFWLAKEIFPTDEDSPSLVAILSAFWIGTSYWHITFSRAGQDPATLPLFSSAAMYFLWRGIRSQKRWPFLVSGVLLGATLYGYRAARFLPVFLVILFGCWVLNDAAFRQRHLVNVALLVMVAAVTCIPLAVYAAVHPEVFFSREVHVFVFNPEVGRGTPVRDFVESLVRTMGMFSFKGDYNVVWNPGRRPVLDPVSSVCFLIGLAVTALRWKSSTYRFVLLWFLTMALPGAFTFEHLPSFTRGIGALPALCLLSAIGVASVKSWLEARISWRGARGVFWAALPCILVSTTLLSYRDYFVPWQQRLAKGEILGLTYIKAAAVMNATRIPNGVWILPATTLRPRELPFYEVSFLYDGPEPESTIYVDEETAPTDLSEICDGQQQAAVVNWKWYVLEEAYTSWNSDPKALMDFLLRKYGRELDRNAYEAFDVITYQLPESLAFSIAENFEPLTVNFGDELILTGMAFGGSSLQDTSTPQEVERRELPSGKSGWVVLRWRALGAPSRNYKVAVHLQDEGGHIAGQADKLLLSNYLHPTRDWQAGQEEIDYYTLPSWGGTAPGRYKLGVTVYDAESLEAVGVVGGGQTHELGTIEIVRPLTPGAVQPQVTIAGDIGELAPGIRLLGYDLPRREVTPGDKLSVALYWQTLEDVNRDYLLAVQLTDAQGQVWAEEFDPPVYGTYPTTDWTEGEILRDWHAVPLPADMAQASYQISVLMSEDDSLLNRVGLERIYVRGRARQFVVPEIRHSREARLGEGIQFLGYDLNTNEVSAGGTLHLTLYWQALGEMQVSYKVFTHLLDAENRIRGQKDSFPGRGEAPTTSWLEGEVIADEYEIVVDSAAPPGEYVIEIGMYDANTGQRLLVYDIRGELQEDRILLEGIRLVASE